MKRGFWFLKFVAFGVVALGVLGLVTQALWNWLVPELFNGPVVTFWQALGLIALSKILFWSFGGRSHKWGRHPYWNERFRQMNPEDRERFRQKMYEKWCRPRQEEKVPPAND